MNSVRLAEDLQAARRSSGRTPAPAPAGSRPCSGGASVADNIANANGEHGIDVLGGTDSRVSGNTASFNSHLGIDAVGSVIDGGGNTATGNGSLHPCENVVCTGR